MERAVGQCGPSGGGMEAPEVLKDVREWRRDENGRMKWGCAQRIVRIGGNIVSEEVVKWSKNGIRGINA